MAGPTDDHKRQELANAGSLQDLLRQKARSAKRRAKKKEEE